MSKLIFLNCADIVVFFLVDFVFTTTSCSNNMLHLTRLTYGALLDNVTILYIYPIVIWDIQNTGAIVAEFIQNQC